MFQDDKPVNMFEAILPLIKKSDRLSRDRFVGDVQESSDKGSEKSSEKILAEIGKNREISAKESAGIFLRKEG